MVLRLVFGLGLAAWLFGVGSAAAAEDADAALRELADRYMDARLQLDQPEAYFSNLPLQRHDRFYDNSPQGLRAFRDVEDRTLQQLREMNPELLSQSGRVFHASFIEKLTGRVGGRICRQHLWGVSHMGGPHTDLDLLLRYQPVATPQERLDALARWQHAADWFRQEQANLSKGLDMGFSAPRRVVDRVVQQLDGITSAELDQHPYLALAERADDEAFSRDFRDLLQRQLLPAMRDYRDYLAGDYREAAREALGLHALPGGRACYIASYRNYTTLQRTPEQVFEIGSEAVAANRAAVTELGREIYDTDSFEAAVAAANADPSQRFSSAEQMQAFYEELAERSRDAMPRYFSDLPSTQMVVEPIPEHQWGSGRSAHYRPGDEERPGTFAYDPTNYTHENFGSAELVTVHEGYPGHHMQIGLSQDLEEFHPLQRTFWNSAYGEGWARYAENLAEEAGLYRSKSVRILRRAWPARGMVVDPGLHLLGWSNEQAREFLVESGMPHIASDPDALLDRIAVMPAQLTSYDSGALEIFALRRELQRRQGEDFDLREFHRRVLMNGMVPLAQLRAQVLDGDATE